ncbi:MAG: hypothetical protein ACTSQU_01760 [Promethearchaeota archaeon]
MDKIKIQERIENIAENLSSPDVRFQSAALNSFIELISNETLTSKQKNIVLPYVEKILLEADSSLREEVFKVVYSIGIREFHLISHLFAILFKELEVKNRFRTEIVMNLILEHKNSSNPIIQDSISDLIENTPKWFDESYLIPIIKNFWEASTQQSYQFLTKYLKDYDKYLNQIKKEKAEQKRLREELKKREEKFKKLKEQEKIEMKHKLEEYVKSISDKKSEFIEPDSHLENKNLEKNKGDTKPQITVETPDINNDGKESSPFTTFTGLGLKRKAKDLNERNDHES